MKSRRRFEAPGGLIETPRLTDAEYEEFKARFAAIKRRPPTYLGPTVRVVLYRTWRRTLSDIGLSAWLVVVFPFVRLVDLIDGLNPPCRLWPALRQVWTEAR